MKPLIQVLVLIRLHFSLSLCGYIIKHKITMIDNFFEDNYHSYDKVYQHPETQKIIYLGDMQSAIDNDFLHNQKIKTVITAARDMEHIIFSQHIKHIVYPLIDGKSENIANFFQEFYQLIEERSKKGNILVHCAAGISRSSTLVISYVMKKQKLNFKEAIALVRQGRPNVLPNLGFQRQLKAYEKIVSKSLPLSRSLNRSQVKTSQSSKRPYLNKFELLSQKFKNKVTSLNKKLFLQKFSERELQIFKIYHHKNAQSGSKQQLRKLKVNSPNEQSATLSQIKVQLPKKDQTSLDVIESNPGIAKYRKRLKTRIYKEDIQKKHYVASKRFEKSIQKIEKSSFL